MTVAPLLALLAWTGSSYRDRFPLPDLTVSSGWGVNIHFTDPAPGEMEKIRDAGFKWVRMDLTWSHVERRRGQYDFRSYDRLMERLDRAGIRAILILDYGNGLYEAGAPKSRSARAGFTRFVAEAVKRYAGRGVLWELWNEPNLSKFWQPAASFEQYAALGRDVGRAIRRIAPEEWFVGPAVSRFDWAFLEGCMEGGLLEYWDAVTIHPYRHEPPETVAGDWMRLRSLLASYGKAGIPLLSGEWGYSERFSGMNARRQAQYAVRQYLVNLACGVPLSIWYDWRDDGTDPAEIEHHFGTVGFDLRDKPAYVAMQGAAQALAGLRIDRVLPGDRYLLQGERPRVVELVAGEPSIRPPKPSEQAALSTPVPGYLVHADGPDQIWTRLQATLGALGGAERLVVRRSPYEGPAVEVVLDRASTESDLEPLGLASREPVPASVSLSLRAPGRDDLPLYEGRWGAARPLRTSVHPSSGLGEIAVTVRCDGTRRRETVAVELSVSGRTLRRSVSLDKGGGTAIFPWHPWEAGSETEVRVLDALGRTVAELPSMRIRGVDVLDAGMELAVEGDSKVWARATRAVVDSPKSGPGPKALRLDYRFDPGWRYFALLDAAARPLVGQPEQFSLWVHGDASGDTLRMRFEDASGQTFQPDWGPIDWIGWKRVVYSLRGDGVGRWGGANDGIVHLPIRITTPALVDSTGRRSGRIHIADAHVLWRG